MRQKTHDAEKSTSTDFSHLVVANIRDVHKSQGNSPPRPSSALE